MGSRYFVKHEIYRRSPNWSVFDTATGNVRGKRFWSQQEAQECSDNLNNPKPKAPKINARNTFMVESLFEGKDYIGVFNKRTGELLHHIYGSEPTQREEETAIEEPPVKNDNQLGLF